MVCAVFVNSGYKKKLKKKTSTSCSRQRYCYSTEIVHSYFATTAISEVGGSTVSYRQVKSVEVFIFGVLEGPAKTNKHPSKYKFIRRNDY